MLHFLLPVVNCSVECILEIFGNFFFVELLFNSVDNSHYSANIFVKHITLLQALIRYYVVGVLG
jgi:hypothetical protein